MTKMFDKVSQDFMNAVKGVLEAKKVNKHGHDAVGKEDDDIDNDGDTDTSDKYLHNRRKAIGKAIGMKKESKDDMPFKGPYKTAAERKDEYGNTVKNVAKHLAKKAMNAQKNEETLDEMSSKMKMKLGLYGKKKKMKEEAEQVDETSKPGYFRVSIPNKATTYHNADHAAHARELAQNHHDNPPAEVAARRRDDYKNLDFSKASVRRLGDKVNLKSKFSKEEVEQVDEISGDMKSRYKKAASQSMDQAQDFKSELDNEGEPRGSRVRKDVNRIIKNRKIGMKRANEEAEGLDEKLSDEAKAAIRHAAGGRGAKVKPLVKLAQMGKKPMGEEAEQVNELSVKKLDQYRTKARQDIIDADDNDDNRMANKRAGGYMAASRKIAKKLAKEDVEQVDEISKVTMGRYINKAKDSIDTASYRQGNREALGGSSKPLEKKLTKRHKGISMAVDKLTKEEIEMIEAIMAGVAPGSMEGDQHMCATKIFHKEWAEGTPVKTMHADPDENGLIEWYDVMFDHGIERVMTEDMEILDERMHGHMKKKMKEEAEDPKLLTAIKKKLSDEGGAAGFKPLKDCAAKIGINLTPQMLKNMSGVSQHSDGDYILDEEVELDEARGRPKKAGQMDYTVHPRTKEKLIHNNPAHMKRIEMLQKNKVLDKPKTEANQHIMNQLQKAKTSMLGGSTIQFTHGQAKHVSGTHAAKLLTKYAGMKPDEKEAFQKKIGHSHEQLMKHV